MSLYGISSYLDVIDRFLNRADDLADHIRQEMGKCSHLIAVVSEHTRASQWVPWEIGVATEKNYPLATYTAGKEPPPEFLKNWPYLRSKSDVDQYALATRKANSVYLAKRIALTETAARRDSTKDFFRILKAGLGQ